jgi:hypothetical protein
VILLCLKYNSTKVTINILHRAINYSLGYFIDIQVLNGNT